MCPKGEEKEFDPLCHAYNCGKHGNLREFVNSGKLRGKLGNLKYTRVNFVYQTLYYMM